MNGITNRFLSLIAALASYLDARYPRGHWLVRMEDLDPPREQPGAAESILHSLRSHGLIWDGEVMWQSRRDAAYDAALGQLKRQGELFACDCTRALLGPGGCCRGRCLPRQAEVGPPCSLRLQVKPGTVITFDDACQGPQRVDLGTELPDFPLRRKDGLYAYQLAVVVDDTAQAISHVVRGSDLLDSTARQIYLQDRLGLETPQYFHIPVITDAGGHKFSKQNHAPPLADDQAAANLRRALAFLGQPAPPQHLDEATALLEWATAHWQRERIPNRMSLASARP